LKERGSGERVTDTGKWRETEREGEGAIKGKGDRKRYQQEQGLKERER
jgi:hypothetical protein